MPAPRPIADVPIVDVAFVNRRADMLVLDKEGVLGHYDLAAGLRSGQLAEGRDLVDFEVPVDRIWGITSGPRCAVRMPDGATCAIAMVDIATGEVCEYRAGLPANSTVCEQTGQIFAPARASAVLELSPGGQELRVLRSLSDDQWMSYNTNGIIEASDRANEVL
jgi:hypothetical protein